MNKDRGVILIVTLWVLTILTLFAIALGKRASLEIKLTGYQRDKIRAIGLARAAIERAIGERLKWEADNPDLSIGALNQPWANNEEVFKDIELGDETFSGTFSMSYFLDGDTLYGMEDERSKININTVDEKVLIKLLENCGREDVAKDIATSIVAWRTEAKEDPYEDYPCKNEEFKSIPELLLVHYGDGENEVINPEILYGEDVDEDGEISPEEEGIAKYLTVFPYPSDKGSVNINTASKEVLKALIDGTPNILPDVNDVDALVEAIADYRKGDKGYIDGGIFSVVDGDVLQVQADKAFSFEKNTDEWKKLQSLVANNRLCVSSDIYTIYAQAQVNKVKAAITATVDLRNPAKPYLYWHRN